MLRQRLIHVPRPKRPCPADRAPAPVGPESQERPGLSAGGVIGTGDIRASAAQRRSSCSRLSILSTCRWRAYRCAALTETPRVMLRIAEVIAASSGWPLDAPVEDQEPRGWPPRFCERDVVTVRANSSSAARENRLGVASALAGTARYRSVTGAL